jgi:general secretion pathway protein E
MIASMRDRSRVVDRVDARELVDRILCQAVDRGASDAHVEPTADGCEVRLRVDGLLETIERLETPVGRSVVGRLMVMGHLLTYRLDVPQEGRIEAEVGGRKMTMRLSVMPTTHGLRAAVRLPAELIAPAKLHQLGLPETVRAGLEKFAHVDSGMLILTGPAGAGKTTTIYALLEYIAQTNAGVSIIALEDPVERDLPGVTQIEVTPFGELTYERTLRSILRQDPQVLMLGEIRDAATASLAVQAALSGHRLISTLHSSSGAGAIARLMEMSVEPYQITSAMHGVVSQRLLRKRDAAGYRGRTVVAEMIAMDSGLRRAVLDRADARTMDEKIAQQPGYRSLRESAADWVARGVTDEAEVARVLGGTSEQASKAQQ